VSLLSRKTLAKKLLSSKLFRKAYVWEHLKRSIPFQIRTMRDERGWSQERAAKELGKTQSIISRLESPAYGKVSLQTLVDIAEGFDVGLLIKFVPFSRLVAEYEDVSASALSAKSLDDPTEAAELERWSVEDVLTSSVVRMGVPLSIGFDYQLALNASDLLNVRTSALHVPITARKIVIDTSAWFPVPSLRNIPAGLPEAEPFDISDVSPVLPGFFAKGASTNVPLVSELVQ